MNQNEKFPILVSTISTLVITLLEIAYSLTWGILFVYYIEKKSYSLGKMVIFFTNFSECFTFNFKFNKNNSKYYE